MSSHLTASASGVHSTIRNRNTNGMFIMYMPQMFDKSFSVRACCLRGFFFYTKVPFVTIKYCWQDREFTPPSPCAGVHSTTTPPGNPAPTASGSIPYFLIFFKTLKNYGFHILHWLLSEGVKKRPVIISNDNYDLRRVAANALRRHFIMAKL